MPQRLVIIGAGMASGRMLEHLFAQAPEAFEVTLFNAEPRGTYNRLMLSPVLAGELSYAEIVTHDDAWYARHNVTCRFGEWVTAIDRDGKRVIGTKGAVPYDRLVIATGSTPYIPPLPGHDLPGVIAYRDVEDTDRMIGLGAGDKAVVIGGGLLGLEAAAGMAARGVEVTVVHRAGHLMNRQLDAPAADLLQQALEARGITVVCNAQSQEILADNKGQARALRLADGSEFPCDLVLMAVGIVPSVGLARAAGLTVGQGVCVDDQLATSDPSIYALGECVEHRGAVFGLVAPLFDQAKVLAQTLRDLPGSFVNKDVSAKLKVTGCDLFSAGDFSEAEGRDSITFSDLRAGVYKRLVIENNRLIGAVIYGDTQDGGWFFNLIRNGADVSALRDTLIFGPAYQGAPKPESVATAQDHAPIEAPVLMEISA
ncbi:Pyridine nucleotide-disulphide oxidoreductase [Celeribacter baekdonensis]|uniref:Pyridine nucleotide-disulphide oxidoreductase n=1 Tax=Celeribacter baekdonensis TaxID=875171 RepID=A0A1G7K0J8_9RHOB|nr:Pyridine nucleotide-disulphide oxidoreductase [Celeribacter baekdonensis]